MRDEVIEVAGLDPARVGCIPNVLPPLPPARGRLPAPWLAAEARRRAGVRHVSAARAGQEPAAAAGGVAEVARRRRAPAIAGSGSGKPRLRARIETLGLAGRAQLLGYVASPRPYLRAADGFVLASDEEGFGQVLSEAMREGLPVISTDAAGGGARFVLDDGRAGLLVPRRRPGGAGAAIAALAEPATRRRYAELARARAAELHAGAGRGGAAAADRARRRDRRVGLGRT